MNEKKLVESLILMCAQYLRYEKENGEYEMNHECMTAGETALDLLEELGYVKQTSPTGYTFTDKVA